MRLHHQRKIVLTDEIRWVMIRHRSYETMALVYRGVQSIIDRGMQLIIDELELNLFEIYLMCIRLLRMKERVMQVSIYYGVKNLMVIVPREL